MKQRQPMKTRKTSLYLFPVILLLLHLMFAGTGYYFFTVFRADLFSRTAEYKQIERRLQLTDETQLNKDYILEVMSDNLEHTGTFMELFGMLAVIGAFASCLSVA